MWNNWASFLTSNSPLNSIRLDERPLTRLISITNVGKYKISIGRHSSIVKSTQFVDLRPVSRTFSEFIYFYVHGMFREIHWSHHSTLSVEKTIPRESKCVMELLIMSGWVRVKRKRSVIESLRMKPPRRNFSIFRWNIFWLSYSRVVSSRGRITIRHMRNVFVVAAGELNEIEFHLAIVDDKIMSLLAFLVKFSAFLRITAHLSCVSSHSCLMFDDCRRCRRKILFVYHSPVRRFFILDTLFFLFFWWL